MSVIFWNLFYCIASKRLILHIAKAFQVVALSNFPFGMNCCPLETGETNLCFAATLAQPLKPMSVPPVLLGRRRALKESKGSDVEAAHSSHSFPAASGKALDESRGQASWTSTCCRCSAGFWVVIFTTGFFAKGGMSQEILGNDARSWTLGFSTLFAGWTAFWLWLVAPTPHILLAARFLMLNWCGGLFALLNRPAARIVILILELLGFQYLAQHRFKSLWPALDMPLFGVFLGRAFWLELGLIFCGLTYAFLSAGRPFLPYLQYLFFVSMIVVFVIWTLAVLATLCRAILMLRRALCVAREEGNMTAAETLLLCRKSTILQFSGFSASLATSFILGFVSFAEPTTLYVIAQCVNIIGNVVGVMLLSKAYEMLRWRQSARPPALTWLRCCNCSLSHRNFQHHGSGKGSEWEVKTAELAGRGISLLNLLTFYKQLGNSIMPAFQPAAHTTNDVVRLGIIPQTAATCSSYAQLVNSQKVIPMKMVTHNWSNLFRDLMSTVIADALGEHSFELVSELLSHKEGVKVVEEMVKVQRCLEETYWICAFAVNQHAGICGGSPNGDIDPVTKIPHPTCACKTPKFFNKDPPLNEHGESIQCEMNKFDDMMALLAKEDPNFTEVVAVDADLKLFGRAWCMAEVAEAHRMGMAQNLLFRNRATLVKRQCTLQGLQVENMKASRPEDVQQILAKIPDTKVFNEKLQDLIFDGQVGLLAAWKKADVLQQMEDLSYILKWTRLSQSVDNGALVWRSWIWTADGWSQKQVTLAAA